MRKKLISLLIPVFLFLAACGSKIPDGMNTETYETGIRALEIMDKYNDVEISADEADQRLDTLYNKLDSLELNEDEESENLMVKTSIFHFQYLIGPVGNGSGDTYEEADELREYLGAN